MKLSRTLLNEIIKLSVSCSKDVTRWPLNHVFIENRNNGTRLTACDGHKLVQVTNGEKTESSFCILANKEAVNCFKALLKITSNDQVEVSEDFIEKRKDFYPNCSPLFRKQEDTETQVSFNVEYLYDIFESMREDKKDKSITLSIKGDKESIYCYSGNENKVAILMPMKITKRKVGEL